MTRPPLDLDRFRTLLEAYGTHFERWPLTERHAGRELVLKSREARALFEEHSGLDAWLEAPETPALPPALQESLFQIPNLHRQALPFGRRSLWFPGLAWAAAAAFGLWLGTQVVSEVEPVPAESAELVAGSNDGDTELAELASGAFDSWAEAE